MCNFLIYVVMRNNFINALQNKRSVYLNPAQATTLSNCLNLLSSGIYTEEERFVFELLQNSVDAYNGTGLLNVRILLDNDYLVFMHNGDAFSERDVEGLCDVGNGNKMRDMTKIGYKGIGFKSVFMHSTLVTVESGDFCFKFDKDAWSNYWDANWGEQGNTPCPAMPWQIIPIVCQPPVSLSHDGFNVVTYIRTNRSALLHEKIIKLLSTSDFLLFLRHADINIDYIYNGESIKKIEKKTQNGAVELRNNGSIESTWLVYCNPSVTIPEHVRKSIASDGITPDKLKEAKCFDLSFAIPLDSHGRIDALKNSCVYTYLPTSISFGFPFLVNANFITDAGRQHLVKDSEWNKMVLNAIPGEFLTWMSMISREHKTYYKVLPSKIAGDDVLSRTFDAALENAIDSIAFIPAIKGGLLKVKEAIMDCVGISEIVGSDLFLNRVNKKFRTNFHANSFIAVGGFSILQKYGLLSFNAENLIELFEDPQAFEGITFDKDIKLVKFLFECYGKSMNAQIELREILKNTRFLYSEDGTLDCPKNLFIPSNYREEQSLAEGAKFLHQNLYDKLAEESQIVEWLSEIGLCEMNEISVIRNLFCKDGYINEDNALEVGRFIFDAFKHHNLSDEIESNTLSKLKFLTKKNTLKTINSLFLGHEFKPDFDLELRYDADVFISESYANGKNLDDWSLFFKKLGICTNVSPISFDIYWDDIPEYIQHFLQKAKDTVSTYSNPYQNWKNPFHVRYFRLSYLPLLEIENTPFGLSKIIWNYLLKDNIPNFDTESVHGVFGCCLRSDFDIKDWTECKYAHWILKTYQTFPASNGQMLKAREMYKNTPLLRDLFGKYLPYIDVDCEIDESWMEFLPFKTEVSLDDYLMLLTNIATDVDNAEENRQRISKVYQKIVEDFDIHKDANKSKIKSWALDNKILSQDGIFVTPKDLRHITIDGFGKKNRAYVGNVNNRNAVIDLLQFMGVTIITETSIKTKINGQQEKDEIKNCLIKKVKVLALLKAGEKTTKEDFDKELSTMYSHLEETHFYHCDRIDLTYGDNDDTIEKATFAQSSEFYYTGELRLSKIDPMATPLCSYLNIKGKERDLIVTMFENIDAIREYLAEKEYDISYLYDVVVESTGTFSPVLDYNRNEEQRHRDIITGFKGEILVYEKLKALGYDPICNSISDENDFEYKIDFLGRTYYCKSNYDQFDISFMANNGCEVIVEVKTTTSSKETQTNMPISYREISLIDACNNESGRSYVIVRVFDIDSDNPDVYVIKSSLDFSWIAG